MRTSILFAALALAILAAAFGCNSKNNDSGTSSQSASLNLVGSKQGLAAGFVDYDGDGIEDKLVGAPYAAGASGTGAVLVYSGTSTNYSAVNTALLLGDDDNVGFSIINLGDVDGDGTSDFAIGALHGSAPDAGATSLSGSVTIYKGGSKGQIIKKLGGEGAMDKFGYSLAAGDFNGDGKPDLAVGAPFNTNNPDLYQSGAVYVYFGPDFTARTALYASSANKGLGLAVAAGDMNGDGIDDLLVSAAGKVLVYFGGASFAPAVDSPNISLASASAGFGKAIAVLGDYDGDQKNEIAVGTPNAVINTNRDTGSVYIIRGSASGPVNLDAAPSSLLVRIDGGGTFNRFGASLIALGDVDGDGISDFAAGAPMADVTSPAGQNILSGKVYFFSGKNVTSATTIGNAAEFAGTAKNQQFGTSLAKSASGRLLIGAPRSNMDTGGVMMIDPATGQAVSGGSSGGATGDSGNCH